MKTIIIVLFFLVWKLTKNKKGLCTVDTSLHDFNIICRVEALLPPAEDSSTPALVVLLLHLQEHFT